MFALVVRFYCRDEAAVAGFDELTAGVVHQIAGREPGTLVHATHRVEASPSPGCSTRCTATGALEAHEVADHVQRFHARKDPLLVRTGVEMLSPRSSAGLDLAE